MKTKLLSLAATFVTANCFSQPSIQWQKHYGGTGTDQAFSTSATADGGYVMLGKTNSTNGNIIGNHGGNDFWLVKTDSAGVLQWQKCLGGTADERGYSVSQTNDGGYIMIGMTSSNNGDVSGNHGGAHDLWVVKTDAAGTLQWQKCYGGTGDDFGSSILQINGGGYIVYGITTSNNGDVSGNHGQTDEWIIKLDAVGTIQWQKCFGGTGAEGSNGYDVKGNAICVTGDGGYFVSGCSTTNNNGDVTGHHLGPGPQDYDCWVLKTDSLGVIEWEKSLGGTQFDRALSGFQTINGNYIVAGQAASNDGDVTGHIQSPSSAQPSQNSWIVQLDTSGNIQWQKCLGISTAYCIARTSDGGYVVGEIGKIVKLDSAGNIQWQKLSYGNSARTVWQTSDDGYIAAGYDGLAPANDFELTKYYSVPPNVITGYVYQDLNSNCLKDSNESGLAGKIIKAMPGNYYAVTDVNGDYSLFVDTGFTYTVSCIPSQYWNQSCPASSGTYNVNISSLAPNSYGNNFADTLTAYCSDLKLSIGTNFFRRCLNNNINICYSNSGTVMAANAVVTVSFDSLIIPLSSSIPWVQAGNNYIFNIDTIQPGQWGSFYITDSVSCAAVIGLQSECVWAAIHSDTAECDTANNTAHDCHYIIGSCDPNGKEVAAQDNINNGYLQQENITASDTLTYLIRFQNTGSDTAFTVVVRDTLSPYLDASTVESGAASHPYTFRIYGQGILEWTFNNTLLTDSISNELASHGFIKFSVRQISGNLPGTIIKNNAAIWFDYNQPVTTDTTINIIPLAIGVNNTSANYSTVIVYPNPFTTQTILKIYSSQNIENAELKIIDIYGREIKTLSGINSSETKIERGNLASGIYFYKLFNSNAVLGSGKIVVE